jgi:hypothetical protein
LVGNLSKKIVEHLKRWLILLAVHATTKNLDKKGIITY